MSAEELNQIFEPGAKKDKAWNVWRNWKWNGIIYL